MDKTNSKQNDKQPENDLGKVSGVTARNYKQMAWDFMKARQTSKDQLGILIDPQNEPQQWGAWFSYFKAIKRSNSANGMKRIHRAFTNFSVRQRPDDERKASLSYIVPAKFPSDFDEDRDWLDDKMAGDKFMDWFKTEKDKQASVSAIPPEDRKRAVKAALKGTNLMKNLDWRPGQ